MSGRLAVTASVGLTGPLAEGNPGEVLDRYAADVRQAIANRGVELLGKVPMDKSGRSKGNFRASLHTVRTDRFVRIPGPTIRGVTWAPWLEGTSRRNESTGFRGYRLYRRTRLQLDREAGGIAERELTRYLPELGGQQ